MEQRERVVLTIDTDGGPVSFIELSDFMLAFRAAYVMAVDVGRDVHFYKGPNPDAIAQLVIQEWSPVIRFAWARLGHEALHPDEDLQLLDISRENPIEWVVLGLAVPLVAAVILSGGEAKLPGFKFKLPPLGKGIAELRKALGSNPSPPRRTVTRTKRTKLRKKPTGDQG